MLKRIADGLAIELVQRKLVDEERADVAGYGFEVLISTSLILMGVLLLGLVFNVFVEALIYVVFFGMLRISAGGAHAKSHRFCFVLFSILTFASITISYCIVRYTDVAFVIALLMLIESWFIIELYAPVDSEAKPLSIIERRLYKNRSKLTLIVQGIVILIISLLSHSNSTYYMVAASAVLIESITLVNVKRSYI